MIRNYFITTIRNIKRNLSYSLLNIFGLALGITTCLIIFLVVKYELGYDSFYKKSDRIYRVGLGGVVDYNAHVSLAIAPALKNDFPELEDVCQVMQNNGVIKIGQKRFDEEPFLFADKNFTNVFDYTWLAGDAQSALIEPNNTVLTKSIAKKYFGNKDPMGQLINLDKKYNLKVTGVIKDPPSNTHLVFNFLVSFETIKPELNEVTNRFYTIGDGSAYVVLPKNHSVKKIDPKLHAFVEKNWGKEIAKESFLTLQPLREIHFDQRYVDNTISQTTSREIYWALEFVALFIILMVCINFINLSTAQATKRAKEIGIRKVLGGNRKQLFFQFMGETTLIVCLALSFALVALYITIPSVARWLDVGININQLKEPDILLWIIVSIISIILLAGLYPSFVQSSFSPIKSLKRKAVVSISGIKLRTGLVFFQFVISQILVIATLIVAYQMDFLQNKDLGFNKERVVSFNIPDINKSTLLKNLLHNNPNIEQISLSSGAPSYNSYFTPFHSIELGKPNDEVSEIRSVDEQYIKLFGLKLLAGTEIIKRNEKDTMRYLIVNEELVHKLGIQNPQQAIGKEVTIYWKMKAIITGVVADFQSESKHKKRQPCILLNYFPSRFYKASIRIHPNQINKAIESVSKTWSALFPDNTFKYEFIDEHIATQYNQERKEYTAFKLFSAIAIIIGCLGLYGLVAFASVQKTKEIGIRKVIGASIFDIVKLLSNNFLVLTIIASFTAFPIAWYFMNMWLQHFAYHININWKIFFIAGLSSIFISLITISHQAIKAALINPIKSLKTE